MTDTERLNWLEGIHTLHQSVEFLYCVDHIELQVLWDGNFRRGYSGIDLRNAIDNAMRGQNENRRIPRNRNPNL